MDIFINRKKHDFKTLFTFNDFIEHVKTNCKLIFNFDNEEVVEKFKFIYETLSNDKGKITDRNKSSIIYGLFGLSNRQQESIISLKERGFDDAFIKTFLLSKGEMRSEIRQDKINNNNVLKTYVYNDIYEVKSEQTPKCRICGSKLLFRKKKNGTFEFIRCANKSCSTNSFNNHKKYLSFFSEKERKFKRSKNLLCIEYWLEKGFSEEEAKQQISNIQSERGKMVKGKNKIFRKEDFYKKYGEEADYILRKRSVFCIEYWLEKGFSEEEAKQQISNIQREISKKQKPNKESKTTCIEYWLKKGYTEEEAKTAISKRQSTFTLKKCIEKYGVYEGTKKWEERQKKWQESLHKNNNLHVGYSAISQELFSILEEKSNDKDYIFYGSKNREYSINENGKNYIYDFCDLNKRKIIEFNGDIYHGNPLLYNEDDKPNPFKKNMTCKDLWNYDKIKKEIAEKNQFSILTVWENDYRKNKENEIEKCLNFLQYE